MRIEAVAVARANATVAVLYDQLTVIRLRDQARDPDGDPL